MKPKPKIALFCDTRGVHFQKWIAALREREYELQIFSPWPGEQVGEEVLVLPTRSAPFALPKAVKTLGKILMRARNGRLAKKQLAANPPQIVHAHYLLDSGWMAAQLDFHPFIVTVHGSDLLVHPKRSRLYSYVARKVLQKSDCVIVVSKQLEGLAQKLGAPNSKVRMLPSFIDTDIFTPRPESAKHRKLIIGSARNLRTIYNVETLIRAAPAIAAKYPEVEIQIAGGGSQRAYLENLALELGIKKRITFLGSLNQAQMAEFLRTITIYVSTALSDGLSVTLLEAAACGAFPVLADIEGNRLALNCGLEGDLFDPTDPKALAQTIVARLEAAWAGAAHKNGNIIREKFGKEAVVSKMEAIYREFS